MVSFSLQGQNVSSVNIIPFLRNASLPKVVIPFATRIPVKVKGLYGNGPAAYSTLYEEDVMLKDGALSMCK